MTQIEQTTACWYIRVPVFAVVAAGIVAPAALALWTAPWSGTAGASGPMLAVVATGIVGCTALATWFLWRGVREHERVLMLLAQKVGEGPQLSSLYVCRRLFGPKLQPCLYQGSDGRVIIDFLVPDRALAHEAGMLRVEYQCDGVVRATRTIIGRHLRKDCTRIPMQLSRTRMGPLVSRFEHEVISLDDGSVTSVRRLERLETWVHPSGARALVRVPTSGHSVVTMHPDAASAETQLAEELAP